ncbi:MAG: TRAP transporter small permease [Clostridia bacterium]|nr:TRAP transporter small permease [Clostridia bacterium]MBQ3476646.1 TRAP transporter small permease [Clostridia bacterium]MBQ6123723.1 TRAP transporter small permease [Clostridia bacterium]MBQ6325263.1 TRAP transporter small permease [Clostridia bacterium]MBQ9039201.1 TRAP transporter small permease [Clostridia bacterium]
MQSFRNVWKKVDTVVFTLVKYVCVIILAALVAVVFSIFFGRYVLSKSPIWGEPFSLLCLVWMSLLGSALVVRRNEHLRVTMLDEKFGEKGVFITEILSTVCIVVFSLFLIYYGGGLMGKGANNNMAGINVPYSVMYCAMPVTGVLNLFALVGEWLERSEAK